jgi:serine/threonine protein phosphatase PrpC
MEVRLSPYKILACGISHTGSVRQNNEDVWAEISDYRFFILADGMGGHQDGEIAAKAAVNVLCRIIQKKIGPTMEVESLESVQDTLRRAIEHVNLTVYKMGRAQPELRGMGTTLCCLLFHSQGVILAHVGDSRIYRMRNKILTQMTKDHSLVCDLLAQGQIDNRQANDFMYKNIITKAIGTEPRLAPSLCSQDVQFEDIYLMCSDGLSDLLTIEEIQNIMIISPSLTMAAEILVATANTKGGFDNITVVIAKVEGINEQEDLSR